jgi:hypothetical protein
MSADAYLIVEQQGSPILEMPELLKELASRYGLDGYSCRQLLLGQTEALLTKGPSAQLTEIKETLADYKFRAHVIIPSPLKFAPFILSRVEIGTDQLKLIGRDKQLIIPRDSRILIFLAELSGSLAERNLSQILSAHRYTGSTENSALPLEKWQRTILQGRPVLDIYLLDDQGKPSGAVRAFPGKYDHRSLGKRATLSANQNLLKLSELAQEYASHQRVDMRFGLSPLAGASLQAAKADDLEVLKKNLRSLTRYAWLQADIDCQREQPTQDSDTETLATATTGLLGAIRPELAASLSQQRELISELSKEIGEDADNSKTHDSAAPATQTLPTPPAMQHHNIWTNPKAIGGFTLMLLFGLLVEFGEFNSWLAPLLGKAISSGALSGLLAAGLFIGGFRLLHLKRLIENTPTSKVRSIAMGRVEVHGTARRQYALFSPMTNIACIYYRLVRYKRNQKNNWVVSSITSSGHVPFWIEDETGRVSVDPSAATVKAGHRQESMAEGGTAFTSLGGPDEKWVEEMIYDGALVYVLGEAQLKKSDRAPIQQRRAEALRRIKQDSQKLASYDANQDGKLDEDEWQVARDKVDDQLLHEDLRQSSRNRRQVDQVVISKPRHCGLPFVIAETASEAKLTGRYAWVIWLMFAAACVCSGLSIWLLMRNY